jgi:hypothetical protein
MTTGIDWFAVYGVNKGAAHQFRSIIDMIVPTPEEHPLRV